MADNAPYSLSIGLANPSTILWGSEYKLEPVALTFLAAALEASGHTVEIFDFEVLLEVMAYEDIVARIAACDVIGLSFYSYTLPDKYEVKRGRPPFTVFDVINDVKRRNSKTFVVLGGPGVLGKTSFYSSISASITYYAVKQRRHFLHSFMQLKSGKDLAPSGCVLKTVTVQ